MALDHLPLPEMLASGGFTAILIKGIDFLAGRQKSKAYTMGAVDHAVQTAMTLVTERLEKVEKQHEVCESELREVKARLDATERERADLKAEIDRGMSGPVAGYAPRITE